MPQIPVQTLPEITPAGAPGVFQRVPEADPTAFGELRARGFQQLGGSLEKAGDTAASVALLFQSLQNETRAKEADRLLTNKLIDLQFNPKTGFQTKLGKDAVDGYQPAFNTANQIYEDARAALPNDEARRMFDNSALRSLRYSTESMASHAAQQNKQWMLHESEGRIQNFIDQGAAYWNDDKRFAQIMATVRDESISRAELMGLGMEATNQSIQHYQSEAWAARLHSVMAHDPDAARAMFDANADAVDAPHRAALDAQIANHQYTWMMRENVREQREERQAEHDLRILQTGNESNLLARAISGEPPSPTELADALRAQKIRPDAYFAIERAKNEKGQDNNEIMLDLWKRAGRGEDITKDVYAAVTLGELRGVTGAEMVRYVSQRQKEETNQEERGYFNVLKTALGGHALEQGMIDLTKEHGHAAAALWARANEEWTRRVVVNHEDMPTVLHDMLGRFQPILDTPRGLPRPRMGPVSSLQDVGAVWQSTADAYRRGELTKSQYDHEADLLVQYKGIYEQAEQRRKAAEQRQQQPSGGKKAKLKSVTQE